MKKTILTFSLMILLFTSNSCRDDDTPTDPIEPNYPRVYNYTSIQNDSDVTVKDYTGVINVAPAPSNVAQNLLDIVVPERTDRVFSSVELVDSLGQCEITLTPNTNFFLPQTDLDIVSYVETSANEYTFTTDNGVVIDGSVSADKKTLTIPFRAFYRYNELAPGNPTYGNLPASYETYFMNEANFYVTDSLAYMIYDVIYEIQE